MNSETQVYEVQILEQLTNSARVAVTKKVSDIEITFGEIKSNIAEIKVTLRELKASLDRAEWWLKFIFFAVILYFFQDQLMSFL